MAVASMMACENWLDMASHETLYDVLWFVVYCANSTYNQIALVRLQS